jgi:hypothetical protein
VVQALAKHEFAEVLVRRYQNRIRFAAPAKDSLVVNSWVEFSDEQDIVASRTVPVDNLLVHALVRYEIHPAIVSRG